MTTNRLRSSSAYFACALLMVVSGGPLANALTLTHAINDVNLNFRDPCDGPLQMINLGDMSITVSNSGANKGMTGTFTVDPAVQGSSIFNCFDLHWLQYITADDCPATVAGVAAGSAGLPFPVVDTPPNGWDYIYKDNDAPADGIQADERVPGNTTSASLMDDANDTLPWYHTSAEEAMAAGSGNETGGLGTFTPGKTYQIKDVPGFCPGGGCTSFTTFLVAVPKITCTGPDCLATNEMLVLAGFEWIWSSNDTKLKLGNTAQGATNIDTALRNTGFSGWSAFDSGSICCPEPSGLAVLACSLMAPMLFRLGRRRASM
jgi:hypothetical protein